jgi:ParB/RepB/Spo0J family partition protein
MSVLGGEYKEVAIDLIHGNEWNPNVMKDKEFDRLVQEIEESGMIDPIQVVPNGDEYRIIGGHHRHSACKLLGYEAIPAIVLTDEKWQNVGLQKLETVRLNIIKGSLNPEKFLSLYHDVAAEYGDEAVADLMGFTDEAVFNKMVNQTKQSMKDAGLPEDALRDFDEAIEGIDEELRTVDNLSEILHRIFRKYGDTVDLHFMYFDWGGKKHLYVEVSAKGFKEVERMMDRVRDAGVDAGLFFQKMAGYTDAVLREVAEDVEKD